MPKSDPRPLMRRKALLTGPIPYFKPSYRDRIAVALRSPRATRAPEE